MSLEMKELIKIIDTIRRRLWRNAFFTNLLKGMIAGSFAGFFLNCVALFYPILWQGKKVIFLFLCSEIVCLVYGIFQLPNRKKTAQIGKVIDVCNALGIVIDMKFPFDKNL